MAQQTAVEWLIEQLPLIQHIFIQEGSTDVIEQAKRIEKEQRTNAYVHGQNNGYMYRDGGSDIINVDQYYNITFGNK